jgi:hypothetical protein
MCNGFPIADSLALEQLADIQATAELRGLLVSASTYVNTRRRPPRQAVALLFRRPTGGKTLLVWWPAWGRARTRDGSLVDCPDWSAAIEQACEVLELTGVRP